MELFPIVLVYVVLASRAMEVCQLGPGIVVHFALRTEIVVFDFVLKAKLSRFVVHGMNYT